MALISDGEDGDDVRAKLNAGVPYVATVEISSSDILALDSSPKLIVAAPGAGKVVVVKGGYGPYNYGTTPYTGDGPVVLSYADTSEIIATVSGLDEAASRLITVSCQSTYLVLASVTDAAVVLKAISGLTGGNGTASITFEYMIIDVS